MLDGKKGCYKGQRGVTGKISCTAVDNRVTKPLHLLHENVTYDPLSEGYQGKNDP